jgi:hypothetical protein
MPIRWKVVRRKNRRSYIVSPNSEYSVEYLKGSKVKENTKSLGIMCFETEELARKFAWSGISMRIAMVIKVNGIGRGKKIKEVARISSGCMLEFYIQYFLDLREISREVPEGTICYKEVEVLT